MAGKEQEQRVKCLASRSRITSLSLDDTKKNLMNDSQLSMLCDISNRKESSATLVQALCECYDVNNDMFVFNNEVSFTVCAKEVASVLSLEDSGTDLDLPESTHFVSELRKKYCECKVGTSSAIPLTTAELKVILQSIENVVEDLTSFESINWAKLTCQHIKDELISLKSRLNDPDCAGKQLNFGGCTPVLEAIIYERIPSLSPKKFTNLTLKIQMYGPQRKNVNQWPFSQLTFDKIQECPVCLVPATAHDSGNGDSDTDGHSDGRITDASNSLLNQVTNMLATQCVWDVEVTPHHLSGKSVMDPNHLFGKFVMDVEGPPDHLSGKSVMDVEATSDDEGISEFDKDQLCSIQSGGDAQATHDDKADELLAESYEDGREGNSCETVGNGGDAGAGAGAGNLAEGRPRREIRPNNSEQPCDICGHTGYVDCIVVCCRCKIYREHQYCLKIMDDVDPEVWVCEKCEVGEPTISTITSNPSDIIRDQIPSPKSGGSDEVALAGGSDDDMEIDMCGGCEVGATDMVVPKPAQHTSAGPKVPDHTLPATESLVRVEPVLPLKTTFEQRELQIERELQRCFDRFVKLKQPEEVRVKKENGRSPGRH